MATSILQKESLFHIMLTPLSIILYQGFAKRHEKDLANFCKISTRVPESG